MLPLRAWIMHYQNETISCLGQAAGVFHSQGWKHPAVPFLMAAGQTALLVSKLVAQERQLGEVSRKSSPRVIHPGPCNKPSYSKLPNL